MLRNFRDFGGLPSRHGGRVRQGRLYRSAQPRGTAPEALARAVAMLPLSRMLLETDCPYLAAEPWRGKRNHPALLGFTALSVARIRNMPVDEVWSATGQNACAFFGLPELS